MPKIYAIVHAERTALRVARPLHWFRVGLSPLIWLLNTASNAILRLVGVDPKAEFEEVSSSEDLKLHDRAQRRTAASSTRARRACSPASSTCTSSRRAR